MASKHKSTKRLQDRQHRGGVGVGGWWGEVAGFRISECSGVCRSLGTHPLGRGGAAVQPLPVRRHSSPVLTSLNIYSLTRVCSHPQFPRQYPTIISILFILKEKVGNVCVTQMIPEVTRETLSCSCKLSIVQRENYWGAETQTLMFRLLSWPTAFLLRPSCRSLVSHG